MHLKVLRVRAMPDVNYGHEPDFVEYAAKTEKDFKWVVAELTALAKSPGAPLNNEDRFVLDEAGADTASAADRLAELFSQSASPMVRGDLFFAAYELAQAAFSIGRIGSTSQSAAAFFKRLKAVEDAQKSVLSRSKSSERWKAWCKQYSAEILAKRPGIRMDDLVDKLREDWPQATLEVRIGRRRIQDYLSTLNLKNRKPRVAKAKRENSA